jgi:hypothetical protein
MCDKLVNKLSIHFQICKHFVHSTNSFVHLVSASSGRKHDGALQLGPRKRPSDLRQRFGRLNLLIIGPLDVPLIR